MKVDVEAQKRALEDARTRHRGACETTPVIAGLRAEVSALDSILVPMLARRVSLTMGIGLLKHLEGKAVFDQEREAFLLRAASGQPSEVVAMYREIIRACRTRAQALVDGKASVSDPVDGGDSKGPP